MALFTLLIKLIDDADPQSVLGKRARGKAEYRARCPGPGGLGRVVQSPIKANPELAIILLSVLQLIVKVFCLY